MALGDDTFALPYWNWSKSPSLPEAFRDRNSALYNATRNRGVNPGTAQIGAESTMTSEMFCKSSPGLEEKVGLFFALPTSRPRQK